MNISYINFYLIFKFIVILLALFGGFFLLNNIIAFIKDLFFKSKDTSITNNLIDKSLMSKNPKDLAIDNNHEIQDLKVEVENLKTQFNDMNDKLKFILEELQKRG